MTDTRDPFIPPLADRPHDRRDPDPMLALWLDRSIPIDDGAKAAILASLDSRFRRYVLPFLRPCARLAIILIQVLKAVLPRTAAPRLLHHLIFLGLRRWVRPDANWLILRHFHIGSEILSFIRVNAPGVGAIPADPLLPRTLADLRDNLFLRHDLNLYNFVIDLNADLRRRGADLARAERLDWSMITDGDFPIDRAALPRRWTNIVDLESAIELFTPIYQALLTDADFWRSTNSLQLDETIAIYAATIGGDTRGLWLVNNRHPLVPLSTLRAGYRLLLHGLAAEALHYRLREGQRAAAKAEAP